MKRALFFTDLDGTFLDHHTYSYQESLEGLDILRELDIPLVMVSSKTRSEMQVLHLELHLDGPFVFENGGGIVWGMECDDIEYTGARLDKLQAGKQVVMNHVDRELLFFDDLAPEDVVRHTGLNLAQAHSALKRETTLPFITNDGSPLPDDTVAGIKQSLESTGLTITRGGRFYHLLSARAGKGDAVKKIVASREEKGYRVITGAVGDSDNDLSMLKEVDFPFLVRKHDGSFMDTSLDGLVVTDGIGPGGFTQAVKLFREQL